MELLKTPKTAYLLEAGLEILHQQSNEWLNEIAFWRDETAFFYSLFVKKTLSSVPIGEKNKVEKIESELIKITGEDLDALQSEVKEHEHYLSQLLLTNRLDERSYRDKHQQLTLKFMEFETRIKSLKKEIFTLVEKIDKKL